MREERTLTLETVRRPSRTDTKWWHEYCKRGEITEIEGRLKFGGAKNRAPFGSVIVVFRDANCVTKVAASPAARARPGAPAPCLLNRPDLG
jgi:hypothetical protein